MLSPRQAERVFGGLRWQRGWVNRGAHDAPRIHDLRHTFVVRRVLLWREQSVDVGQAMLALSTWETLANIEAIIDAVSRRVEGVCFERGQLRYKVYVRKPADAPAIREVSRLWLGCPANALFLHADICRRVRLVEIEASGGRAIEFP